MNIKKQALRVPALFSVALTSMIVYCFFSVYFPHEYKKVR